MHSNLKRVVAAAALASSFGVGATEQSMELQTYGPVSYTHLTLPTIYSV